MTNGLLRSAIDMLAKLVTSSCALEARQSSKLSIQTTVGKGKDGDILPLACVDLR